MGLRRRNNFLIRAQLITTFKQPAIEIYRPLNKVVHEDACIMAWADIKLLRRMILVGVYMLLMYCNHFTIP